MLHFLFFTSEERAHAARAHADQAGWSAQVRDPVPRSPEQWTLVCERDGLVLTPEIVRTSTDYFEALAADQDGAYDGWEASAD